MSKQCVMVVGIGLVLMTGVGMLVVRADESPAAPDVKKLADQVGKKDWAALSREGQTIAKKLDEQKLELLDVMYLFRFRKKGPGVSGIGVGETPGAIVPDGIEAKTLKLSKVVQPADLDKAADLKRMAEISAAVAAITIHMPNDNVKQVPGGIKKWQRISREMHDASKDLIKALDAKNLVQIKTAATKLQNSCTRCHR
ncbi:MAG: hypothetical protein HYS12_04225 [Planctomycetes bacterium]|nr:hypothetical protein [Planctomycetota bacterium]